MTLPCPLELVLLAYSNSEDATCEDKGRTLIAKAHSGCNMTRWTLATIIANRMLRSQVRK
jgi:hypothetical protein